MNRVAIALNTKDKPEQVRKVVERLLHLPVDLFWYDGSDTNAGKNLPFSYQSPGLTPRFKAVRHNVRGSGDNAVVQALTDMLADSHDYTHIGIIEDDVLLSKDWFPRTMALFAADPNLTVGAVSARAYEDRVLLQRDDYAIMHNLGWGQVIFTREAAELTLQHYRTGWTSENRRVFAQLAGVDIAPWWAFRAQEQWICSDWGNDAVLAQHGLASLALTPSPVEMLGQTPPLEEQGLRLVTRDVPMRRDERIYQRFCDRMRMVRDGQLKLDARPVFFALDEGGHIYLAHQLGALSVHWFGGWSMVHNLGFGPFGYRADDSESSLAVELSGAIDILAGGGDKGGSLRICDMHSGYEITPQLKLAELGGQLLTNCVVPAGVSWRTVRVDRITPGVIIYGIRAKETQPIDPRWRFDASSLPPASEKAKVLEAAVA
jgi:hypothetical protein